MKSFLRVYFLNSPWTWVWFLGNERKVFIHERSTKSWRFCRSGILTCRVKKQWEDLQFLLLDNTLDMDYLQFWVQKLHIKTHRLLG